MSNVSVTSSVCVGTYAVAKTETSGRDLVTKDDRKEDTDEHRETTLD